MDDHVPNRPQRLGFNGRHPKLLAMRASIGRYPRRQSQNAGDLKSKRLKWSKTAKTTAEVPIAP
jgi:hypothetical protein